MGTVLTALVAVAGVYAIACMVVMFKVWLSKQTHGSGKRSLEPEGDPEGTEYIEKKTSSSGPNHDAI